VEARFFASAQTGPGAHRDPCTMGTGSFPGVKSGRSVTLTLYPLLVLWSRKSRATPLLPYVPYGLYRASVPVQGCTLPFYLLSLYSDTSDSLCCDASCGAKGTRHRKKRNTPLDKVLLCAFIRVQRYMKYFKIFSNHHAHTACRVLALVTCFGPI